MTDGTRLIFELAYSLKSGCVLNFGRNSNLRENYNLNINNSFNL